MDDSINQLRFFRDALSGASPKRYNLNITDAPSWVGWSDASFEPGPGGILVSKICWIIRSGNDRPFGVVYEIPATFWELLGPRKTNIIAAEALAVPLMFRDAAASVCDRQGLHFIDNLAALSGFVKGYSTACDLSTLYLSTSCRGATLRTNIWYEWVPSASNPADGGSRVGLGCPLAHALGIPLFSGVWRTNWPNFEHFDPEAWRLWWGPRPFSVID